MTDWATDTETHLRDADGLADWVKVRIFQWGCSVKIVSLNKTMGQLVSQCWAQDGNTLAQRSSLEKG